MKKLSVAVMSVLLVLCMAFSSAMASNAAFFENSETSSYTYVSSCAATKDTAWFLVSTDKGYQLASWQDGMDAPVFYDDLVVDGRSGYYAEDGEDADKTKYGVSGLFSDGTRIMAINPNNGLVFEIKAADGKITYEDVVTLKDVKPIMHIEDDYSYALDSTSSAVVGDRLCYMVTDWDSTGNSNARLVYMDLTTGDVTTSTVEDLCFFTAYKDGKLLAFVRDNATAYDQTTQKMAPYAMVLIDPATDQTTSVGDFAASESISGGVAYCKALDAVIWIDRGRIMGLFGLTESKQVGYLPADYADKLFVMGTTLVSASYDGTYARTLSADFSADEYITVYNGYMDDGSKLFASRYPNVPIYASSTYYTGIEQISQAMVSGDNSLDVLNMYVSWNPYDTLLSKGYCADLSADAELAAFVDRLYPCLKELVTKDGKLYAVPTDVNGWGWFYNPNVMESMGLTEADLPTNLVDMCAFLTRWNDEWVDEYSNYVAFDWCTDYKAFMFNQVLTDYMNYCTAKGEEVKFDSPVFRQMMQAVEAMRVDDLNRAGGDESQSDYTYRESLFMTGYQTIGDFTIADGSDYQRLLKMKLTADADYVIGVDVTLSFINPKTTHMTSAMNLLKCKVEAIKGTRTEYVMCADMTEPLLNPSHDRNMASMREYLQTMKDSLAETPDENKAEIQANIDEYEKYVAEQEAADMYYINEKQLAFYQQELAPYMFVIKPTFFNGSEDNANSELTTLMKRYQESQISLDQFIKEADNKLRMMQMENY